MLQVLVMWALKEVKILTFGRESFAYNSSRWGLNSRGEDWTR